MSDLINNVKSASGNIDAYFSDLTQMESIKSVENYISSKLGDYMKLPALRLGFYFAVSEKQLVAYKNAVVTNPVPVIPGQKVLIDAKYQLNAAAYVFLDSNQQVICVYPEKPTDVQDVSIMTKQEVTVPVGASYVVASAVYATEGAAVYVKRQPTDNACRSLSRLTSISENAAVSKSSVDYTDGYELGKYFAFDSEGGIPDFNRDPTNVYAVVIIDLLNSPVVYATGKVDYAATGIAILSADMLPIALLYHGPDHSSPVQTAFNDVLIDSENIAKTYPGARYVVISSYNKYLKVKKANVYLRSLPTDNDQVLYGKKYIAIGDSFTHGDWSGWTDSDGNSGTNSSEIYDTALGVYKTYPYWIAKRNSMTLVNMAVNGSTITKDGGNQMQFSNEKYKDIPLDADYITIRYGLNDTSKNVPVGAISDSQNTTFCGAWNTVLSWITANLPNARIGIVNEAAYLDSKYRDAVNAIGKKYGIPVLDLYNDPKVPMIMGHADADASVSKTVYDRHKVSSSNGHPNLDAHKRFSTVIENFLRSL